MTPMKSNTFAYLIAAVIACMIILLLVNTLTIVQGPVLEKFILPNDVRGMAVLHRGKEYTLNFSQQNTLLGYLNQALPQEAGEQTKKTVLDFDKIIIYTFRPPNIEVMPIAYIHDELLFTAAEWNSGSPLLDTSRGQLKSLLPTTYDP